MQNQATSSVTQRPKRYITEQEHLLDAFRLGRQIYDSGFRPDFIAGIWRGGSATGIIVQECLQYLGIEADHTAIRTSYRGLESYDAMIDDPARIRVHGLGYLEERLDADHNLLLVDDVYGSGRSIAAVCQRLQRKLRANMPGNVRSAAVWYRPVASNTVAPDYHVHRCDEWLVLPYELSGLSHEDLENGKPWIMPLLGALDHDVPES